MGTNLGKLTNMRRASAAECTMSFKAISQRQPKKKKVQAPPGKQQLPARKRHDFAGAFDGPSNAHGAHGLRIGSQGSDETAVTKVLQ